jgi:hypothetical protein
MLAIASLILILTFSLLITRVATIALIHTGLSRQTARFQARSALTGVGFTTEESEKIVNHPVRRRVLMLLMLIGNAGVVTAVASLILTFVKVDQSSTVFWRILLLAGGLSALWGLAASNWLDQRLSEVIAWALKRFSNLILYDYASLLHLGSDYRVSEMHVDEGQWMAHRRLRDMNTQAEGVLILGVTRLDGSYIGAPSGDTKILPGDSLIVYGLAARLKELEQRPGGWAGDLEHLKAKESQEEIEKMEQMVDSANEPETSK